MDKTFRSIVPSDIKIALARRCERYSGNNSGDALDFMITFLRALHDDLNQGISRHCHNATHSTPDFSDDLRDANDAARDGYPGIAYHRFTFGLLPASHLCGAPNVGASESTGAAAARRELLRSHASPIIDAFATQLQVQSTCQECGCKESWFPHVLYLSCVLSATPSVKSSQGCIACAA